MSNRHEIDFSQLTVRTKNCLINAGIKTNDQLRHMLYTDLIQTPNLGRKGASEVLRYVQLLPETDRQSHQKEGINIYKMELDHSGVGTLEVTAIANTADHARRIAACVNACAGISTEQLEMDVSVGGEKSIYESQEAKVSELIQQKNILLEAVKGIVNFHNEHCEDEELYPEFLDLLNVARAAIAKAESQ